MPNIDNSIWRFRSCSDTCPVTVMLIAFITESWTVDIHSRWIDARMGTKVLIIPKAIFTNNNMNCLYHSIPGMTSGERWLLHEYPVVSPSDFVMKTANTGHYHCMENLIGCVNWELSNLELIISTITSIPPLQSTIQSMVWTFLLDNR